jgi:magnesium chelatase family protein|tara:strand:+ start:19627 stop:21156 length:1530 start_codon:yes stop_codon:yes gene_type:complete
MALAVVYSRAQLGIESPLVTVEVQLGGGLPGTSIVGLAETAVKESKDRVRGALKNLKFGYPQTKVTINLAPADLPKEGGRFDLPIALGILAAIGSVPHDLLREMEFIGELALTGGVRSVSGVLPAAIAAHNEQRSIVIPNHNKEEAALLQEASIYHAANLMDICQHLNGGASLPKTSTRLLPAAYSPSLKLSDIRGQFTAKRALQIAAAGGHNVIFIGPPGTGKTMLASRLPYLLPSMPDEEAMEVASIQSVSRFAFIPSLWRTRPFRTPHHTASPVAMVGGGNPPKPGEISLAHQGVLFLDELPEFTRKVLEVLREPMESGEIMISRAKRQVRYPARFQLVAAMNPCPCGYYGDERGRCSCSEDSIIRYRNRISGPLLDRIDLHVDVPALPKGLLSDPRSTPSSDCEHDEAVNRVHSARRRMYQRTSKPNRDLSNKEVERLCSLGPADRELLDSAMEKFGLSARAYFRILKVARTIADLSGSDQILTQHLTEALSYRQLDRYQLLDGP